MKIKVKDADKNIKIIFPTCLLLNRLTAFAAPKFLHKKLKSHGIEITSAQAVKLIKTLKRFRRRHKNWKLVEVNSADGEHIEIRL